MVRTILGRLALLTLGPVAFFAVVEVGFCIAGYRARGSYLKSVDSLVVYDNFFVGDDGIYRARRDFAWADGVVINEDGFRSHPFGSLEPGTRIAVIGDSFGWGSSAKPLTNSFADLLDANPRYTVFNLSIPGTGPDQYALVAEKFIPLIKPHVVILAVYMGNDINGSLDATHLVHKEPRLKKWYVTNAGIFMAMDQEGNELSPQAAYDQARTLPLRAVNLFRSTACGTQLVNMLYNFAYRRKAPSDAKRCELNGELIECLAVVARACSENGARFVLAPIPVNPQMENTRNSIRDNLLLFQGYDPRVITGLDIDDYAPFPDDHFNNRGHKKMAEFLKAILEEDLPAPAP